MHEPSGMKITLIVSLAVMVSACAGPGEREAPQPPSIATPAPSVQVPDSTDAAPVTAHEASAAYQPLLARAAAASERGDYEMAMTYLERAQRIGPDAADVYLAMAQTHAARGDRAQAAATAERGLLYCRGKTQCDALRRFSDR